jgi:hypothetical protein
MPNHWHLVLWPVEDGELSAFVGWLSHTHAMRYRTHYHDGGVGHLYQQRYKSFPVQDDAHFLNVARYVERNALRANLVKRAEDWRWGSLWRRTRAHEEANPLLHRWPVDEPSDWLSWVNKKKRGHSSISREVIAAPLHCRLFKLTGDTKGEAIRLARPGACGALGAAGGRPGGRSVRSSRKARAVSTTQVASLKGLPRLADRRNASEFRRRFRAVHLLDPVARTWRGPFRQHRPLLFRPAFPPPQT